MQGIKFTTKTFVEAAKLKHGDKYDYSLVVYTGAHKKVKIICSIHGEFSQPAHNHIRGAGCKRCNSGKTKTKTKQSQEDVITQFISIYDNKFDYSMVIYKGFNFPVKIICNLHKIIFFQKPRYHIKGSGCEKCIGEKISLAKRKNVNVFIAEANEIHQNKYDYSFVIYKNEKTKVKIICPIHDLFWQTPESHIHGKSGCPDCGDINTANNRRTTTEEWIEFCQKIHNNKYNYAKSIYVRPGVKTIINCPNHGDFPQCPRIHMNGSGCKLCSLIRKYTIADTELFISKAKLVHGELYDYNNVEYNGSGKDIQIICAIHGFFSQKPTKHLQGHGCHKCAKIISKPENDWLNSLSIPNEWRQARFHIGNKFYKLDAFDPNTKTVYEFYGDFWHGNPKVFDKNRINPINCITFGELYSKTIKREKILIANGYKIISIWEKDWNLLNHR